MKKFILLFITFILLFQPICIALEQQDTLTPPTWEDVVISGADYEYIEPKKRPKWQYPLAWVGYIGTIFLVPFPLVMYVNDQSVRHNNNQFYKYDKIRKKFENDIQQCDTVYTDKKELYGCYTNVKQHYQDILTKIVNNERQEQIEEELRIQNSQIQYLRLRQNSME